MLDNYLQEILAGGGITLAGVVSALMTYHWWTAPPSPKKGRKHLKGLVECLHECERNESGPVSLKDITLGDADTILTNEEMQWEKE